MSNLERFTASLAIVKSLLFKGEISKEEFYQAEDHLAKKYCIKIDNLYRSNDLILFGFRGIYMNDKKEEIANGSKDNENRSVTAIEKKT